MRTVIASSLLPKDILNELSNHGIRCIQGFKNSRINNETAYHPDMLFYKLSDGTILSATKAPLVHKLDTFCNVKYLDKEPVDGYPYDCVLNCFTTSKTLICGPTPSEVIIDDAVDAGLDVCRVRQGYCACSTVKINGDAFISSDVGIIKGLNKYGHDTLFVTNEGIELYGYNNGFIGGCVLCVDDKMFFTGAIEKHINYEEIKLFADKYGKKLISLSERKLYDYGGFIPL